MLLGEDGAWFANRVSVVKVKPANISSFSLLWWSEKTTKKGILEMSTGEDFALSKSMQFWGVFFLCFFRGLLNLLVKISTFAMKIIENVFFFKEIA